MPSVLNGSQLWLIFKRCSSHISVLFCEGNETQSDGEKQQYPTLNPDVDMGLENINFIQSILINRVGVNKQGAVLEAQDSFVFVSKDKKKQKPFLSEEATF